MKPVKRIAPRNGGATVPGTGRTGSGETVPAAGSPSEPDMTTFDIAFRRIAATEPLVMVLGGAGTGKTTFLHELRRRGGARQVFLAPTGVAALQLGGQTIHSFFGIPPRILNPDEVKPSARSRKLLGKIDRLVIDEVSMVRCDLLDVVDRCLRIARNRHEPFGGVQVVLVGDFLQLPPVVPFAEQNMLARMDYSGPYAFDAKVLRAAEVARVPFTTVHRQTDRVFIEHLTRIRHGDLLAEAIEAVNLACCRPHRADRTAVVLAPTNARVDAYNHAGLSALASPERVYLGETKGEFDLANDRMPVPESLVLKVGARVMAVRNDVARRWVNGSVGSVTRLADDHASVRLDAGHEVEIERASWERIRYAWNDTEGRVVATVIGSYTQLPLVHAWASTVHKAQGLTLDDVRIDFDRGAFAPGQSYVALSRARSLGGLSLARPLKATDVRVDRRVVNFMTAFESDERALRLPAAID
jgi:ATP-dependent DNA helicase PIF1